MVLTVMRRLLLLVLVTACGGVHTTSPTDASGDSHTGDSDTAGKITDLEVSIAGHKLGVSVTRAVTFPFGQPYTVAAATTLMMRKLGDIKLSTANVSAADRWDKQILAVLAWDEQAATSIAQAWPNIDAATKANTVVVITTTAGDDLFIYTNM